MKKRLQLVVVLLMFLALVGALASCQYRPIQENTTTETPSYEVVFVDLDGTTGKVFRNENKLVMEFFKFAAPVTVEFEPGRMMKIIEFNVRADHHDHGADWVEGLKITHENGGAKVEFDLEHFRQWRMDDSAPYRFNLSSGKGALVPRKPWPYRLLVGNASTEELIMAK